MSGARPALGAPALGRAPIPRVSPRASRIRARSSPASPRFDGGEEARSTPAPDLPDLTAPGLSPWEVLGLDASVPGFDPTVAEVRAAYRARAKVYHPDVYPGDGDADAMMRRLGDALDAVVASDPPESPSRAAARSPPDADPFKCPEAPASVAFVNPFRCLGRRCPPTQCCVTRSPTSFGWREDTGAAGWRRGDARDWSALETRASDASLDEPSREDARRLAHDLNLAVGQCPAECIRWVTPMQADALEAAVERAAEATTEAERTLAGAEMVEMLAKAAFENGRAAGGASRRKPKRTSEWVDWY